MREHEHSLLLHRFLIDTATRIGDSLAIIEDERSISFKELLRHSYALASTFKNRGLKKGDRIAIIVNKSLEAIISIFASLLNGAIYVPLDPRWPPDRLKATLADCTPRFLICNSSDAFISELPCRPKIKLNISTPAPIILKEDGNCMLWLEALAVPVEGFSEPDIEAADSALILFTSGSTGRPKGVTLSHGAVAEFVKWAADKFDVGSMDRLACPSPLSFDLSTFDIFCMALRGAVCVIASEQIAWLPRFLTQFAEEQKITIWYSVPSILSSMLFDGRLQQRQLPDLRIVAFAGEVFPSRNLEKWRSLVPNASYYNLYGPTETNVVAWFRIPDNFDYDKPIPIGKACPYAEFILDPQNREESEMTVTGELLVAAKSAMTGYWNRVEETNAAFAEIQDTCGNRKRFYRTGDRITEVRSSGNYTFLGRMDRQVKRLGFRIELGEVERALNQHPQVLESAAISLPDSEQQISIAAAVRLAPEASVSVIELRLHCAKYLPSYMMPEKIIPVLTIPKGDRGKTDYSILRESLRRI